MSVGMVVVVQARASGAVPGARETSVKYDLGNLPNLGRFSGFKWSVRACILELSDHLRCFGCLPSMLVNMV